MNNVYCYTHNELLVPVAATPSIDKNLSLSLKSDKICYLSIYIEIMLSKNSTSFDGFPKNDLKRTLIYTLKLHLLIK